MVSFVGWVADQLTGHSMRATILTVLNEIRCPKVSEDAQHSHTDPDKFSAANNHDSSGGTASLPLLEARTQSPFCTTLALLLRPPQRLGC